MLFVALVMPPELSRTPAQAQTYKEDPRVTRFVARLMIVLVPLLGLVWAAEVQRTTAAGPGAPILLVTDTGAANPYGPYLGEILRAEGLNSFTSRSCRP